MPISLVVPEGYGYTVVIALAVIPILSIAQGVVVGTKRKAAGVIYPTPYATAAEAKESKEKYAFNCAQRAHGNLLENLPQTMAQLLFAGLFYPRATPVLGAAWVLNRIIFAYGYIYSSKPNGSGRLRGSLFWLVQLTLAGLCTSAALQML